MFNLGNSHAVKLAELLEMLERVIGRKVIREAKPPQPGDVPLTWADISKARRVLGYQPTVKPVRVAWGELWRQSESPAQMPTQQANT